MLTPQNTLLCVFSYNMGISLENCLASIRRHCPDFNTVLADDQSDDPTTMRVIENHKSWLKHIYVSTESKAGRRHGNLYSNIQHMCAYAIKEGYRYLFMIQDDMQFVRPFDDRVREEYANLFEFETVLQVDPRFLRKSGTIIIHPDMRAYSFAEDDYRRSYADVGILNLEIIDQLKWKFLDTEWDNKKSLSRKGYLRVFPFTPIMMHVPFPKKYWRGRKKMRLFPIRRGKYSYYDMNKIEIKSMDSRKISEIPYYKEKLRTKNMYFSKIYYFLRKDSKIFG